MDLLAGVTFLGPGLLYSNLMASLILALLEAVLARDRCLCLVGDTDLPLVLRLNKEMNG